MSKLQGYRPSMVIVDDFHIEQKEKQEALGTDETVSSTAGMFLSQKPTYTKTNWCAKIALVYPINNK